MLSHFKTVGPSIRRAGFTALLVSLSAGCSVPAQTLAGGPGMATRPSPAAPLWLPARDTIAPVLAYADQVRGLQGAELAQEIARLGEPPLPADQMRLAIALSQTRQLYDLIRAQELLQRVLAGTRDDDRQLQTLAGLLAARFAEQRRVEDLLDKQNQQLRELQRRLEQTQEKLDALKEIERSLNNRPAAASASPPNGRVRPARP